MTGSGRCSRVEVRVRYFLYTFSTVFALTNACGYVGDLYGINKVLGSSIGLAVGVGIVGYTGWLKKARAR
jgi:hypothetical protein